MILKEDKTVAEGVVIPEVAGVLLVAVVEVRRGSSCAALHGTLFGLSMNQDECQEAKAVLMPFALLPSTQQKLCGNCPPGRTTPLNSIAGRRASETDLFRGEGPRQEAMKV